MELARIAPEPTTAVGGQRLVALAGAGVLVVGVRDVAGVLAQLVMLALAMLLFAPILMAGGPFGQRLGGAVALAGFHTADRMK